MKVINKRWKKITAAMIAIVMLITIGGITTHRVVEASAFDAARSAARARVPASAELIKEIKALLPK
jgi:hypothetical protein